MSHTVLIVEDDEAIRDLYKTALEAGDFTVLTAKNGEEGLAVALEKHPEVILMDIMMPVMNGHQAVSRIRRDRWGANAKIIYLTNMTDAENVVMAVENQTEKYIIKANMSIKEVVNLVRTVAYAGR